MIKVNFYDSVDDAKLKFAVIIAQKDGKWIFCKHKERSTYELPGKKIIGNKYFNKRR